MAFLFDMNMLHMILQNQVILIHIFVGIQAAIDTST